MALNEPNEWQTLEWLSNARQLIKWINQRPENERVLLLVRHSHRETINDHSVQLSTGLTEVGKRMANEMGKRLPIHNPAHFFFSFVPRCYETAEEMANGFKERGGRIIGMDPLPVLVMPEYNDEKVWLNLQPDGMNVFEFVNRWANGEFETMIQDFKEYCKMLLSETIGRLSKENRPVLHVHVTHDLAIMAIKRTLLQKSLETIDREPYLGGICIAIDPKNQHHQFVPNV